MCASDEPALAQIRAHSPQLTACFVTKDSYTTFSSALSTDRRTQFLSLYANATFCLMPPGDTPYRAAMLDAMAMGCIPVPFHPSQTHDLWQLHWGDWVHSATCTSMALVRSQTSRTAAGPAP